MRSRSPPTTTRRLRGSAAAFTSASASTPSAAAPAPTGLLALPDDILTAICAAAGQAELPALRLSCTGLLGPANAAARRLCLRRASRLHCSLSSFHGAKDIVIEDWTEGWLEEVVQALPGVDSLRLGRLQPVTSATAAALARLPRLRRLDCTGGSLTEGAVAALATLPLSLTSLSLRECCSLSDARLAALLAGLPGLKEADLSLCAQLGDGALAQLGRCTQLAKIDLTGCERFSELGLRQLASAPIRTLLVSACCQLTDGCLEAIAAGMPRLACLGLFEAGEEVTDAGLAHLASLRGSLTALDMGYSTWSHTPAGLQQLLARLTGLRLLNIGGCEGTTDAVVATVAQHCRQLTQLDVSESQRVTAAGVGQLGKLPALLELNLGWNIRLRDCWLEGLPPCLTRLDLSFCGELTDGALRHLGARLPGLASVTLRKCGRITEAGLSHLSACTALSHLDLSHCQHITGLAPLRTLRALASLVLVDASRALHPPCMALLAELPALRAVEISSKRLDDGCMQALSHASQLTSLALSSCPRVSERGLLALCRSRGLRALAIDRCPQLTERPAALEQLQRRLPLLRLARPPSRPTAAALLEY
ncbi:hypothetical protein ABPG77_000783 [Micractinium sp. CCAP 211/92]